MVFLKTTVSYLFHCQFLGVHNFTLSHLITSTAYTQPILGIILRRGCNNKPGSKTVYDTCGVCGGDGTNCIGCDRIKNSGIWINICFIFTGLVAILIY